MTRAKGTDTPGHVGEESIVEEQVSALGDEWEHTLSISFNTFSSVVAVNEHKVERAAGGLVSARQNVGGESL